MSVKNAEVFTASSAEEKPVKYDVSALDLRIGYIREVSRHPDADALYVEQIECGDEPGMLLFNQQQIVQKRTDTMICDRASYIMVLKHLAF